MVCFLLHPYWCLPFAAIQIHCKEMAIGYFTVTIEFFISVSKIKAIYKNKLHIIIKTMCNIDPFMFLVCYHLGVTLSALKRLLNIILAFMYNKYNVSCFMCIHLYFSWHACIVTSVTLVIDNQKQWLFPPSSKWNWASFWHQHFQLCNLFLN